MIVTSANASDPAGIIRRAQRAHWREPPVTTVPGGGVMREKEHSPVSNVVRQEIQEGVRGVLDSLGETERNVIVRSFGLEGFAEMSPAEVADDLGLPIEDVVHAMASGLSALRDSGMADTLAEIVACGRSPGKVVTAQEEEDDAPVLKDFSDVDMRRLHGDFSNIRWQAEKALEAMDDEQQFPKDKMLHEIGDEARGTLRYHIEQIRMSTPTDV